MLQQILQPVLNVFSFNYGNELQLLSLFVLVRLIFFDLLLVHAYLTRPVLVEKISLGYTQACIILICIFKYVHTKRK